MLILWKKLYQKASELFLVPSAVVKTLQSAWIQKGMDAWFFHFLWNPTCQLTQTMDGTG